MKKRLTPLILLLGLGAMLFGVVQFGPLGSQSQLFTGRQEQVASQPSASSSSSASPSETSQSSPETSYVLPEAERTALEAKFQELSAINPETIAYIYAPGTLLDEPVVQTTDNHTYLDKTFDGGFQPEMGTVFMDMANQADFSDRLTWLFGHARGSRVPDHRMFNDVNFYDKQDYFDQHAYVVVERAGRKHYYEAAFMVIVPETTAFYRTSFADDADFMDQLQQLSQTAVTKKADLVLDPKDRYLVLSTCREEDVTIRSNLYLREIPDRELPAFLAEHGPSLVYQPTR